MKRTVLILSVVLAIVLGISLVACSSDSATKDGQITVQYINYQTQNGYMFFEEESLGIEYFEINGSRFFDIPYTIYNLPGNKEYHYEIKAYDADGTLMASASGNWMVVEGFATPYSVTLTVKHQHSYREAWTYDETYHWHASSCNHSAVGEKAEHTFEGDVCAVCGYDKHVHSYSYSWSSNDYYHWHAAKCGHNVRSGEASHTFGSNTVTREPTCVKAGTGTHTCTVCGKTVTYSIPALSPSGHSFGEDTVVDLPTCEKAGKGSHTCLVCREEETYSIPATGHSFGDDTIIVPPTCEDKGSGAHTCLICNTEKTFSIPATGHSFGEDTVVYEPTCTKEGTGVHTCLTCQKVVVFSIPKLSTTGHTFGTGTVVTAPTCVKDGSGVHTCLVCGEEETYKIGKLSTNGHLFGPNGTVVTAPTCVKAGSGVHTCLVCGEEETYTIGKLSTTGHTFGPDGTVVTASTCTTEGSGVHYCLVCGEEETYSIAKNPDNHTANEDGVCTSCGFHEATGGYVFYDKGEYSDGWRYLEAAPADLRVVDGVPTVDSTISGYSTASTSYCFGYYRTSDSGSNLYVNGTTTYNATDCTGKAIGTGKANTQQLVGAMGNEAYSSSSGSTKATNYAARLCDILTYTVNGVTYDDWFLPSKDELNLMYVNKKGLGGFAGSYYWSSSESRDSSYYAWGQNFSSGSQYSLYYRDRDYRVRPVRAF